MIYLFIGDLLFIFFYKYYKYCLLREAGYTTGRVVSSSQGPIWPFRDSTPFQLLVCIHSMNHEPSTSQPSTQQTELPPLQF